MDVDSCRMRTSSLCLDVLEFDAFVEPKKIAFATWRLRRIGTDPRSQQRMAWGVVGDRVPDGSRRTHAKRIAKRKSTLSLNIWSQSACPTGRTAMSVGGKHQ